MASTLTNSGELTYLSFPIEKTEATPDGDLYVYGKASDGSVDADDQIVDLEFSSKAIQEWLETGANVRVQHNASLYPAGVGVEANSGPDGTWVKSLVVEPVAKRLVEKGALRAYSVGIARPKIVRDGVARGGRIVGGEIVEISLVDRPANKNCGIQLVKAVGDDGAPEWVGKMFGDTDVLDAPDDRTVASSGVFSPTDLAKLLQHREVAERRENADKREMDPDVGGGTDRDKIPASDFAGRDRSFPIVTPNDVHDAASSIGRAGGANYSPQELRERISAIAHRKGPEFVAQLPESWTKSADEPSATKGCGCCDDCACDSTTKAEPYKRLPSETIECSGCHKFNAPDAKFCDQCGHKLGAPTPAAKSDDPKAKESVQAVKSTEADKADKPAFPGARPPFGKDKDEKATGKGAKDCPSCGQGYDADSKNRKCEKCGTKLPKANKRRVEPAVAKDDGSACGDCGAGMDDDDMYCPKCGKQVSAVGEAAKTSKPVPSAGVVGHVGDVQPVPEHREPDGLAVESFEHDAGLPTDPDLKAAGRLKSLGVPADLGALHDLTCAAYLPGDATRCHPAHKLSDVDVGMWQAKALDAAVSAPLEQAQRVTRVWQQAVTLKGLDDELIDLVRDEMHKAFQDANPGPGSFPNPTEMSPTRYKRPYIAAGHAAPSPGYAGPNTSRVPDSDMSAAQFERGPLTSGHAQPSPSNKNTATVQPAPIPPGMGRVFYRNVQREAARSAMQTMHDHIAQTFPDLCPMTGPGSGGEPPTGERPVPVPAGASKHTKTKNRKAKATKAASAPPAPSIDVDELVAKIRADVAQQLTDVTRALADERDRTEKLQATVDALADLPDPATAAFKGVAQIPTIKAAPGLPAGARTVAESAEQTQMAMLEAMREQAYTSPDPAVREAAFEQLYKMVGLPTHR